ncbi:MAG: hypothetical protein R3E83_24035 [Burkholderiaceae bacterium]
MPSLKGSAARPLIYASLAAAWVGVAAGAHAQSAVVDADGKPAAAVAQKDPV